MIKNSPCAIVSVPDEAPDPERLASPTNLILGGVDNSVNRVWLQATISGTLNWTFSTSTEGGYDDGILYKSSGPPSYVLSGPSHVAAVPNPEKEYESPDASPEGSGDPPVAYPAANDNT